MVPPGHEVDESNRVEGCGRITFRDGWARPTSNVKCELCATGFGVTVSPSESLIKYGYDSIGPADDIANRFILREEAVPIYASPASCGEGNMLDAQPSAPGPSCCSTGNCPR